MRVFEAVIIRTLILWASRSIKCFAILLPLMLLAATAIPILALIDDIALSEQIVQEPALTIQTKVNPLATPEPSLLRQYAGNVVRGLLIVSLVLVVGVRLYKAYLLKHEKPEEKIKITSRRTVSPKAQLMIAEIDGTEYLLALNQDGVTLLTQLEPRDVYCSELDRHNFSDELKVQESKLVAHKSNSRI